MKIGGFQKISLIDYPKRISAVVFTQGCNFRCPYCHNPELVDPARYGPVIPERDVISFLKRRRGRLDAVTVTGGEPTLQPTLDNFLQTVKTMGYLTKIDTNGSNPDILQTLLRRKLIDCIAMDVKGPLHKYGSIAGAEVQVEKIRKSIDLITTSDIEHEFRTTVVRSQLGRDDLIAIVGMLQTARIFVLQTFVPGNTLCRDFIPKGSYSAEDACAVQACLQGKRLSLLFR